MKKLGEHKKNLIYATIGVIILLILYALKNTNYFTRATTFIFSISLFYLIDYIFKLEFKQFHYIIFILISMAGILLSPLYFISSNYDKILHLTSPILISILVFYLVNKTKLKFSTKLFMTFSIMIMFLTLFEIGEYLIDQFFDFQLQGVFIRDISGVEKLKIIMDRNDDTMIDLILGAIGALIFTIYQKIINYSKN